jgi:hypothetical protein
LQSDQAIPTLVLSSVGDPNGDGGGGGGGGGGGSSGKVGSASLKFAKHWPAKQALEGGYMPVVLAMAYSTALQSYCNQALDIMPLSNPSASTFLGGSDWQTFISCAPLIASWAIVPFASDGISLDTNYGCPNPDLNNPSNPCWPPKITGNPVVIKVLQGFLSVIAVVSCALIGFWFQKPQVSSNDPTSIASVAAIAAHPQIAADFGCPADATMEQLKERIKDKKYILEHWELPDGTKRYGLVPIMPKEDSSSGFFPSRSIFTKIKEFLHIFNIFNIPWKQKAMYFDGVFLMYLVALTAITASYTKDETNSVFAEIFSDSSFGKRIVFTICAAAVAIYVSKVLRGKPLLSNCDSIIY